MSSRGAVATAVCVVAVASACGTRLPDSAFRTPSPGPSTSPSASPAGSAAPTPHGTSTGEVGVTATTVTIGNISSLTNAFDPRAFTGGYYGARAWFDRLNARGGVNGRAVRFVSCDDGGSTTGNVRCARSLLPEVFAFASNSILDYAAASMVDASGTPDVGAQPIDTAYTRYPHLFDIYGESYPRDGKQVGYDGVLTGGTEVYRYFAVRFPDVPRKAGVIYYNQSDSQKYGQSIVTGLRLEGFDVVAKQVNFALPDYDSAVVAMRHAGVHFVFDALDRFGSQRLCKAMDDNRLFVTAKVTTTQTWAASVKTDYGASPRCRNDIWATGNTLNYDDVGKPQVAAFRAQMTAEHFDTPHVMSEWALEGWAGAMWLTDAMRSCGSALTRRCVEAFLERPQDYDAGGLLQPRRFSHQTRPETRTHNCLNVVRWQDTANAGRGGWVDQVADMNRNCFDVPVIRYRP